MYRHLGALAALSLALMLGCGGDSPAEPTPAPTQQAARPSATPAPANTGGGPRVQASPSPGVQTRQVEQQTRAPRGPRTWHGISMTNLEEPIMGAPPECRAMVTHPYRSSPARLAGLQRGDVILAVNGERTTDYRSVRSKMPGSLPAGTEIGLTVFRDGETLELTMEMAPRPDDVRAWLDEIWQREGIEPFRAEHLGQEGWLDSSELEGKVVILDFWATWCGPCRRVMPALDSLYQEYQDQGLVVLGISSEEEDVLQNFIDRGTVPVSYPLLRDPEGAVKALYEVRSLPTLYLVDREGKVVLRETGTSAIRQLRAEISELL